MLKEEASDMQMQRVKLQSTNDRLEREITTLRREVNKKE